MSQSDEIKQTYKDIRFPCYIAIAGMFQNAKGHIQNNFILCSNEFNREQKGNFTQSV